jgi:NAD(P)-dependent dehydrogenase (short-subunit alcohol dehydrogenase family)
MSGEFERRFRLDGRTAIVTGGAGILGKHFCRGLAEFGANVVIADKNGEGIEEQARALTEAYGVRALGIVCDVSSESSVAELVARVVRELGTIHVLHNNAAGKLADVKAYFTETSEFSMDHWREIMATSVDGMFIMARACAAEMIRSGVRGSIVQTGSIYGIMAPDFRIYEGSFYMGTKITTPAVYSTSKAAVVGLTRHLATLWAPHGIRVNTLVPGGVESGQNETFVQRYSARIPLGRMARAEELVGALVYLASDASSYVTGQTLAVDGGLSAW